MDTSTRMYVCMTWCADVESCAPMVSVRLLKKKIMVKEEKFSLTDGQSSLTNSILGFVSPFHIQKIVFGESGVTWKGQ